jgi:AraC-like DNA-binding protein
LDGRLDEAKGLYEQGWSLARVAAHFGVSAGTVLNAFNQAGVATRPVGSNQWKAQP